MRFKEDKVNRSVAKKQEDLGLIGKRCIEKKDASHTERSRSESFATACNLQSVELLRSSFF